jgi:broad-specificity NMP kinase
MRYLKKFNENSESDFDLEFAMSKIKEKYSEEKVAEMFDEEILEWVDSDWEQEYESEYDWYVEHNNGEAQDVIIEQIIDWYKKEYNKSLSDNDYSQLFDKIKSHYSL